MKKYFIIILLFINSLVFSQNISEIKNRNIAFIYFKGNTENFKSTKDISPFGKNESTGKNYIFKFKNKQKEKRITFTHNTYYDIDSYEKDKKMLRFKVDKRFLKNNKNILITDNLLNNIDFKTYAEMTKNKTLFLLIDESEIINNLIIIKEVIPNYGPDEM